MSEVSLRRLNEYYHWILSTYQSFTMCYYDTQTIGHGFTVGYGIDGYDLCRYLFPKEFFIGKPNPHHAAIASTWQSFFQDSDPSITFTFLSP